MPEWVCGKCQGGFPKPMKAHGKWKCPFCGKTLAKQFTTKSYDPIE